MKSIDVANYLIERWGQDYPVTNLKLNKMVYYAQVESIAMTGEPLFDDCIEAWQYGPVEPAVYHAFCSHGRSRITEPTERVQIEPEAAQIIDSAANKFGSLSAFDIVSLSHRPDGAWAKVYTPDYDAEITVDVIKASKDIEAQRPESFSVTLDDVAQSMPNALKMLETS